MPTLKRALALLLFFFIPSFAFAQIPLVETEAGKAFKAGDYKRALEEFKKLAEISPRDPLILRYIGITYHRLGKYDEALATYEKALEIDPNNVAVYFYTAATYFKIGRVDEAKEAFLKAINLAPQSLYAEWARRYIQAIEQQRTKYERPGAPRLWEVYFQVAPQFDYNVPNDPDDVGSFTDEQALRFTEYLSLGLRSYRIKNWTGGTEFSTYQSQHTESDLDDFNVSTLDIGAYFNHISTLLGRPFFPSLRYDFYYVLLGGDSFSNSHIINASFNIGVTENTLTVPFYRLTFDDFDEEGFDPDISSRDAVNNAVGILQYFFFLQRAANIWVTYEFQRNDADGLNFNYNGHRVGGGFSMPVIWGVRTDVTAEYGREDYPDFQAVEDRETNRQTYSVRVSRNIIGRIFGALSYSYTNECAHRSVADVTARAGHRAAAVPPAVALPEPRAAVCALVAAGLQADRGRRGRGGRARARGAARAVHRRGHQVGLQGAGALPPGAGRALRRSLPDVQVPHHGRGRRGRRSHVGGRGRGPADDARGPLSPPDPPG